MFCAAGVITLTFSGCRARGPVGGLSFTINQCSANQVISIRSAEVGFDRLWNPPTCSWQYTRCKRSFFEHAFIRRCNGHRTCSISQSIFTYPQGGVASLCGDDEDEPRDGNIINIKYDCIAGRVYCNYHFN